MTAQINFLAMLVSSIVVFVLGAVWYSPLLFQKPWLRLLNINSKTVHPKRMIILMILNFIMIMVMAFFMNVFIVEMNALTLSKGWLIGFWIGFGFIATTMMTNYMYEQRPLKLYLIDMMYHLISLALLGLIISAWP